MNLTLFSQWLENITQPQYVYYHPVQVLLFGGLSYVSAACFTSIPPKRAMKIAVLAYGISQLMAPFFIEIFEPYREIPLVPLVGQFIQLSASLISVKILYNLALQTLSFKEIRQLSLAFFIGLSLSRFAILKFRQYISTHK